MASIAIHPVTPPKTNKVVIKGGSGNACYEMIKQTESEVTIAPNTFNVWDEIETLTINLQTPTEGIANEYLIQFTSGSTPTVLTLPEDITWGSELKIEAYKIYQISILNNLGTFLEFKGKVTLPSFEINLQEYDPNDIDLQNNLQTLMAWVNSASPAEMQEVQDYFCQVDCSMMGEIAPIMELGGFCVFIPNSSIFLKYREWGEWEMGVCDLVIYVPEGLVFEQNTYLLCSLGHSRGGINQDGSLFA